MQYVTAPPPSTSTSVPLKQARVLAAVLRDDGTISYKTDGKYVEAPRVPRGGHQLAVDATGLWCLSNSKKLYYWQPNQRTWERIQEIQKPVSLNPLSDGRICVVCESGESLVQSDDGTWRHNVEAQSWLGSKVGRKRPSRFRIKFDLRTLLFVIFVAALCTGPIRVIYRAKQRHRMHQKMRAKGFEFVYAHDLGEAKPPPTWVANVIGEEVFYKLKALTYVEDLNTDWAHEFTDIEKLTLGYVDSLNGIEQFKNLRTLSLYSAKDFSALKHTPWITNLRFESDTAENGLPVLAEMPNLRRLFFTGWISSLEPLANLKQLEYLDIFHWENPTRRLDPTVLSGLTNLKELSLRRLRGLSQLDWITGMTQLRKLRLHGLGTIKDLTPLEELSQLEALALPEGTTLDLALVKRLPKLSLEHCDVTHDAEWDRGSFNGADDMRAAGGVPVIQRWKWDTVLRLNQTDAKTFPLEITHELEIFETINLANTDFVDISQLKQATSLKELNLSNTKVVDLSVLQALPKLRSLDLSGCRLADLTTIGELDKLHSLRLKATDFDDLSAIQKLTSLRELDISHTRVRDLSVLSKFECLEKLWLSDLDIDNIDALNNCRILEVIDLSRTRVTDLSPLRSSRLTTTRLESTPITDLSALSKLPRLSNIHISDTPVKDLAPLRSTSLNNITLINTSVQDVSPIVRRDYRSIRLSGIELTELPTGEYLDDVQFDCRRVKDLSPLGQRRLKLLILENVQPHHDFSWLRGERELQILELTGDSPIIDLSPIISLKLLRQLRLPKSTQFTAEHFAAMPDLDVVYIGDEEVFSR